jgi:hypothetical protein
MDAITSELTGDGGQDAPIAQDANDTKRSTHTVLGIVGFRARLYRMLVMSITNTR